MKAEKSPRSGAKSPEPTGKDIRKKKLAFLYLGTKGRLPNEQEIEEEISGADAEAL